MKKIFISFICCVKNEELYILQLIDSIISSSPSFFDWELIIIDDHSQDRTFEIISSKFSNNKKINIFKNIGYGKVDGTLQGLKYSNGDWIKFVDGDDIVSFNSLSFHDFSCDAFYHNYCRFEK